MASTTQQQGDKNSVKEIFKTLNYGPAPEADNVAQVSGLELSNIFYCHDLNVVLTEKPYEKSVKVLRSHNKNIRPSRFGYELLCFCSLPADSVMQTLGIL